MELNGGGGREAPSRPLTAEEEALKRNTDCVYFLASPLTCKKGSECEYRHSEGARVNPRDCYYWLNGNCLNLKCSFRHPPLEALFGNPGTSSAPAPIPAAHPPAAHNPNKQSVPCYYFQKGLCLKGDRCLFMHGPATMTAAPQQLLLPKVSEPPRTLKKDISFPKPSGDKLVEASAAKSVETLPYNGSALKRSSPSLENDLLRSRQTNVLVSDATEIPWNIQSQLVDERLQNGRDTDEFLGESSPGFDVLVDDDIVDSEYIHNEDEFGSRGGRNPYPVTDFNYHHSEYDPVGSFEGDQYNGADEYERYGPPVRDRDRYGRTSSERRLDRQSVPERRVRPREESPEMDGSDLRHRLLKQRKLNGSRLPVSPDRPSRNNRRYVEEERYHGRRSHRDHHIPRESSISSRLQGRITLPPARSYSPDDLRPRERAVNYQGRHLDRTKRRPNEDSRVPSIRRDDHENARVQPVRKENADPLNFAGPKSLAELKGAKGSSTKLGKASELKPPTSILKTVKETGPDDEIDCIGEEGEVVGFSSAAEKEVDQPKFQSVEEEEEEEYNQSSAKGTAEIEEAIIEDQMLGNSYQKNEESDDEAMEGGDLKAEDDESMYQDGYEDLDVDVDDEEEFATKVNAMFYTE